MPGKKETILKRDPGIDLDPTVLTSLFFVFNAIRWAKCNAHLPFKNEKIKDRDVPPR